MSTMEAAISKGIIDEDYHDMLLADLEGLTRQAGIPVDYVWQPLSNYIGEVEYNYVNSLKQDDCKLGMAYTGKVADPPVNERMMAIAGACLRNYINAKVMTVQDVLQALKDDSMPSPTVLLIPNFCMGKTTGGHLADWEKSSLLGLLYRRQQRSQKTIVYVSSKGDLIETLGQPFAEHLYNNFVRISDQT